MGQDDHCPSDEALDGGWATGREVRRHEMIANVSELSEVPVQWRRAAEGAFRPGGKRPSAGYLSCGRAVDRCSPLCAVRRYNPTCTPASLATILVGSTHEVLLRGAHMFFVP